MQKSVEHKQRSVGRKGEREGGRVGWDCAAYRCSSGKLKTQRPRRRWLGCCFLQIVLTLFGLHKIIVGDLERQPKRASVRVCHRLINATMTSHMGRMGNVRTLSCDS